MENKKVFLIISLVGFLIFSFSFISAGFFSDFFKKFFPGGSPRGGCTDSDGGREYLVRGEVIDEWGIYNDTCRDYVLEEFYCNESDDHNSEYIDCRIDLGLIGCVDGACVEKICEDSDRGMNWYEKGIAESFERGPYYYYEDRCLLLNQTEINSWEYVRVYECSGENCSLWEGYCNGTGVTNIAHACNWSSGEVCRNGTCVREPPRENCTDSDGGINPLVFGVVEVTNEYGGTYTTPDRCLDSCCGLLKEQNCNGTKRVPVYINCSEMYGFNYACSNGACKIP